MRNLKENSSKIDRSYESSLVDSRWFRINGSHISSITNIYDSYVPPILAFIFRAKNRPKSNSNLERRVTTFRRQGSRNGLEGRNAGKRDEVRLEEGRKEEEEEEDEEESSQRAPRTERVSSLAQGQALLLERERSNISGIGERKKRGWDEGWAKSRFTIEGRGLFSPFVGLVAVLVLQGRVEGTLELVHPLALLLVVVLPPLDPPILEPDLHLSLGQPECVRQVKPLRPDHVLLSREFSLQPLQLLGREDRTHPLQLAAAAGTRARATVLRATFLTCDSIFFF